MSDTPSLFQLIGAPEVPSTAATFTANIARYFIARAGEWIPAIELERIGGRQAWRTRVSDARREYGMRIENRCRWMVEPDGRHWRLSEYRYVAEV